MIHQFITENYVKSNSPVTYNVDPKNIATHVVEAQALYLQNILGSEFYLDLLAKHQAQTLSSDEVTLVETYIQPAVLWRSIALLLPWLQYDFRNKGLMANNDDNATAANIDELKFMINEAKNRAEARENEIQKYLCKYSSLYPLYKTQDGLTKPDSSDNFDVGLIMY